MTLIRSGNEFTIYPLHQTDDQIARIERFFSGRAIQPSFDRTVMPGPSGTSMRVLGYPLPLDFSAAAQLTVDLLRLAYDVNDETELEYLEINPNRTVHTPVLGWKT